MFCLCLHGHVHDSEELGAKVIPPTAKLQTSGSGYRLPIMESATGMYLHSFYLCSTFIVSAFHNQ